MPSNTEKLIQISSSYFVAGIIFKNNIVIKAAPIVKWMIGKNIDYIKQYCLSKHWKCEQRQAEHVASYRFKGPAEG